MMPEEPIEIRRPGDRILICGECGREQRVPRGDWRKIIRDEGPNEDWDGVLRCQDGHEPASMHAFAEMEIAYADGALRTRYRGRCECGHTEQWTTVKDDAWSEFADHLIGPVNIALARREAERRPRLNRFICIHHQVGTEPCPEGCHGPVTQRVTGGWVTKR